MNDPARRERGLDVYRQVYGDDAIVLEPGQSDFFDGMLEQLFAEVWSRPALDIAARRLLVIGVLAAQGRFDPLGVQFDRVLAAGELTEAQVREIVVHLTQYVGYPTASELYRVAETAIAKSHKASS